MADFNKAVTKTLIREGGSTYTNDPDDRGGGTKYGISKKSYPNLDIQSLTEQQARDIYQRDYWNKISGDGIENQLVAELIFDTAVLSGPRTASRLVQVALSIEPVDGYIGRESLAVINQIKSEIFLAHFALAKIARYAHICNRDKSQKKYLLGWVNRTMGALV